MTAAGAPFGPSGSRVDAGLLASLRARGRALDAAEGADAATLGALAQDRDPAVRWAASRRSWGLLLDDADAGGALIAWQLHDPERAVRQEALAALSLSAERLAPAVTMAVCDRVMADPASAVHADGRLLLDMIGVLQAPDEIAARLDDELDRAEASQRRLVASRLRALSHHAVEVARPLLQRCLADADVDVRAAAAAALPVAPAEAVQDLIALALRDVAWEVRRGALEAQAVAESARDAKAAVDALCRSSAPGQTVPMRRVTAWCLGPVSVEAPVACAPLWERAFADDDADVVATAAEALDQVVRRRPGVALEVLAAAFCGELALLRTAGLILRSVALTHPALCAAMAGWALGASGPAALDAILAQRLGLLLEVAPDLADALGG